MCAYTCVCLCIETITDVFFGLCLLKQRFSLDLELTASQPAPGILQLWITGTGLRDNFNMRGSELRSSCSHCKHFANGATSQFPKRGFKEENAKH